MAVTYNEDETEFLDKSPFEGVLVSLVRGVACSGERVPGAGGRNLLLNKYIGDEAVDDGGAHGGVGAGPEDDARGCENLKSVEHCGGGRATSRLVSFACEKGRPSWQRRACDVCG